MQPYKQFRKMGVLAALKKGGIGTVIGLAMLAFGVLSIPGNINFVNTSATTEGTEVGVKSKFTGEDNIILPTVTFVPEGGRSIVFTSNTGGQQWMFRIGESVTVRYDPADPTNARMDSFFQLWGSSAIPILIGGAFIFFSIHDDESLLNRFRRRKV